MIAQRIKMTAMPPMVAFFHSLVGLAAVLVAAAAFYAPESYNIGSPGAIQHAVADRAIARLGHRRVDLHWLLIAFAKLNENMSGAPILLPGRHLINIAFGAGIIVLVVMMVQTERLRGTWMFWAVTALSLILGITLIIPIGRRRHARRRVDAELVLPAGPRARASASRWRTTRC